MVDKRLHVVHCVDTEGPLHESIDATFERLNTILGTRLEASPGTLKKIQEGLLPLDGKEDVARQIVAPAMLDYNEDWGKLDKMLDEILGEEFRMNHQDSAGNGWAFSWFVMDHVGYVSNPRRRDMGYLNIFDHYVRRLKGTDSRRDEIHWHYHSMSTHREAHVCATSLLRSPHVIEGLCRRVIDRKWFPSCFRAGFHTERPDNHWFLEQWIPFDFSNQAMKATALEKMQSDVAGGRFGDWRRAPSDWSHYHPSHDDYQTGGDCRRSIFRTLNVGTRLRLLDIDEVRKAFARADKGLPTILSFADHDWRDMRPDVKNMHAMVTRVAKEFPDVRWYHSGAQQAARDVLGHAAEKPIQLEASLEVQNGVGRLKVQSNRDSFGPQPFLAIKTMDQHYLTDNLDFEVPRRSWTYTFDMHTVLPSSVEAIGVAVNAEDGSSCVVHVSPNGR